MTLLDSCVDLVSESNEFCPPLGCHSSLSVVVAISSIRALGSRSR